MPTIESEKKRKNHPKALAKQRRIRHSRHGGDRDHLAKKLQERTASLAASKEVIKMMDSKIKNIQYILRMGLDPGSTLKMIKQAVVNG